MVTYTEGDVPVEGLNIHYYRMGTVGKPPVVLLHGFSDMGLCWMRLADDLAPDYDLFALDAVGHGQSGGPEHGFRARAVSDVRAVLDVLELAQPALIGHSMGAATAARVAAENPARVRGLVLEDPPWRDAPPTPPAEAAVTPGAGSNAPLGSAAWAEWNRHFKTLDPEARRTEAAIARPHWSEIDRTYWADAKAQFNLDVLRERVDFSSPPWRDVARHLTCPVLLLTGDTERGAIVTPEVAQEASALWHTGHVIHLPGAGHNLRREQYVPFRTAVVAFLDKIHRVSET